MTIIVIVLDNDDHDNDHCVICVAGFQCTADNGVIIFMIKSIMIIMLIINDNDDHDYDNDYHVLQVYQCTADNGVGSPVTRKISLRVLCE